MANDLRPTSPMHDAIFTVAALRLHVYYCINFIVYKSIEDDELTNVIIFFSYVM